MTESNSVTPSLSSSSSAEPEEGVGYQLHSITRCLSRGYFPSGFLYLAEELWDTQRHGGAAADEDDFCD